MSYPAEDPIPIARPSLGEAEVEAAARTIRSGWVTQGPEVARFEVEFARAVGAAHAVAVANCTVALELALRCAGVSAGDDVVTVSHSFVATANSVVAVGARPVFVDVCGDTLNMDPKLVAAAITPTTRAILCVHQLGMPCDVVALAALARARGLPLIEDAACAIGSELQVDGRWERIGRPHGLVACFSFHPRKVITTGDGGMLTTSDPALAARFRLLRQHAMSIPDTARHGATELVFEEFVEPAYNHRLTDLQASIGRPQLARLDALIAERRRLAGVYHDALTGNAALAPPREPPAARSNWQSYAATLRTGVDQRAAMQLFLARGIATRRGITNAHQEPAYAGPGRWACGPEPCARGCPPGRCERLGASELARTGTLLLPLFPAMTAEQQGRVIAVCDELGRRSG